MDFNGQPHSGDTKNRFENNGADNKESVSEATAGKDFRGDNSGGGCELWDKNDVLTRLRNREDRLRILADLFLQGLEKRESVLRNYEKATTEAEFKIIQDVAHALKGAALNIAANQLAEVATLLEDAARADAADLIERLLPQALKSLMATRDVFREYLSAEQSDE